VRLRQQRYLVHGETAPKAQTWMIPVALKYSDGQKVYTQSVLMSDPTMTVKLKPAVKVKWIHPNADERGYYHWSVSPELLAALSTQARPVLSERERVGLVQNMSTLLEGNMLHGDDYLRSISAFGDDASAEVVDAMLTGLRVVRFSFVTADLRDAYAIYIRRTLKPALDRLGEDPKPGEGPSVSGLRARLISELGVWGQDQGLRQRGLAMTKSLLADPSSVDPSLADVALRLAATSNDTTLYYECRRRFEAAKTPTDRRRYLAALTNFHDPALVDETLHYALAGPLRPQELMFGFQAFDTPELADRGWAWAQENYGKISEKIPPMFRVYLVYFAMGCTQQRYEAAKAFFSQSEHAPPGTEQELAKVTDMITECTSLREREGPRVAKMLTELQASK
jgi:alanyl aminopeptidase